ncbi:MAG: M23 family metallopeptidase [Firmicutes bacterium]|nr:M23 family metallopeptidase [Bacillota bacterium]
MLCPLSNFSGRKVFSFLKPYACKIVMGAAIGISMFLVFPPKTQAMIVPKNSAKPSYYRQLESYRARIEQNRAEQERLKREETLKKALIRHVVQKGDNLTQIAAFYQIDVASILYWNELSNPHLIFPGQTLDILTIEGTLHKICEGDTVNSIAACYKIEPQALSAFNLLPDSARFAIGKKIVVPGATIPPEEKKAVRDRLIASRNIVRSVSTQVINNSPQFKWPLKGEITSRFGWRNGKFHQGLDIAAPHGSNVRAAASGVVIFNGIKQGYGLVLIINHGRGWSTLYAHNSRLLAGKNEKVSAGQPIAQIGESGNATGPHLHLEIIYNERPLDPLLFLPTL